MPQIAVGCIGGVPEDGAIGTQEEPAGFGSALFSVELGFGTAPLGAACL